MQGYRRRGADGVTASQRNRPAGISVASQGSRSPSRQVHDERAHHSGNGAGRRLRRLVLRAPRAGGGDWPAGPAAPTSVTSFSATRSATGSAACATGSAAGWPIWWTWSSCRRSGTGPRPPPAGRLRGAGDRGRGSSGEFWTDDDRSEGLLARAGLASYLPAARTTSAGSTWTLMEKRLGPEPLTTGASRPLALTRTSPRYL